MLKVIVREGISSVMCPLRPYLLECPLKRVKVSQFFLNYCTLLHVSQISHHILPVGRTQVLVKLKFVDQLCIPIGTTYTWYILHHMYILYNLYTSTCEAI